jgi:hypothetical protein
MKNNKKLWLLSFLLSLCAFAVSITACMMYMSENMATPDLPETKTEKQTQPPKIDYYEPQDNVGAISFTEDQITELVRKMFYVDGFVNDLDISFDEQKITVCAKIKDKDKLIEFYPELKKYSAVLSAVQNKRLTATAVLTENDGRAAIKLENVSVGNTTVDADIISPFVETDGICSFFDVEYSDIEITDGMVVFKNDIPDVLKY